MINNDIAINIRKSTCAIIYTPHILEDIPKELPYEEVLKYIDTVIATGFLINDNLVVTNRHVINSITEERERNNIALGNFYLWFVFATGTNNLTHHFIPTNSTLVIPDPSDKGRYDIGFISINPGAVPSLKSLNIEPVLFDSLDKVIVGKEVAICGYPLGNQLLEENELGIFRYEPVINSGMISAVSPFDSVDPRNITTFLSDTNTAGGMSGSPIFNPDDGKVMGIHYAGTTCVISIGIPIDKERADSWIKYFEAFVAAEDNKVQRRYSIINGCDVLIN